MKRIIVIYCMLLHCAIVMGQHQVQISIKGLPDYHSTGSDVYLAGSFNGWNPQDAAYRFTKDGEGQYSIALTLADGNYEYKLTRGGWDKAECSKKGIPTPNRVLKVNADTSFQLSVEDWADRFPATPRTSTASNRVHIIDTAFLIPQLKRTRRIWIYLPDDYREHAYPVLYMHDGQNIFDDATSYSGEWGVDDFLDKLKSDQQCIVVGIDHGGARRLNEYNPYDHEKFGKGEGRVYVDFLVKTLKPYIDKTYKPKKDKANTFIGGSSMGGLISLYAALKYPTIFGGAFVFSPAFWISGKKIFADIKKFGPKLNSKIYFYGGKLEGETMVPDLMRAFDGLTAVSKSKMTLVIRDEGKHNEQNWKQEFPASYKWMGIGK